jgi:uncharacterized membrane protein YfhO
MYTEQRNQIWGFGSPLFSWNGGLGFNVFANSQYYSNSALNLVFLFFTSGTMIYAMNFIILSKFGLAGLTFAYMLYKKSGKINLVTVAFSTAYSVCGYMIAFATQPMWTDVVFLLPLVIIALERLVNKEKPIPYCLLLAFSIYTNFYIGFALCIFVSLYFVLHVVSNSHILKPWGVKKAVKNFALFSAIAGGLAAFSIIPVYTAANMRIGAETAVRPEETEFYFAWHDYLSQLFPTVQMSHEYGMANLYSGGFVLMLIPLFFMNSRIMLKKKIAYGAVLTFLFLSVNMNRLVFLWHGLRFPNQLPGRWTFMLSFLLILMAYEAFSRYKGINRTAIGASAAMALMFVYMVRSVSVGGNFEEDLFSRMVRQILLLTFFLLLRRAFRNKQLLRQIAAYLFASVILIEAFSNTILIFPRDVRVSGITSYLHNHETMEKVTRKYNSGKDDFYRMEMVNSWTFNPGMLYNYKGISYYSSTFPGELYTFLTDLGMEIYAKNVSVIYSPYSPILNSLFGIKYIAARDFLPELYGMTNVEQINERTVWENEHALPIAFIADNGLRHWTHQRNGNDDHLVTQAGLFNAAVGYDTQILTPLQMVSMESNNADFHEDGGVWGSRYYHRHHDHEPVTASFRYIAPRSGRVFMSNDFRAGDFSIWYEGKNRTVSHHAPVYEIGYVNEGYEITVEFTSNNVQTGLWGLNLYMFDDDSYANAIGQLRENSLDVTRAGDTKITGNITVTKPGILYTSIPDDGGWTIRANGKKLRTFSVGEALLAAELPIGEYKLEFSYSPPGFRTGLTVTLMSAGALGVYVWIKYRNNPNNPKKEKKPKFTKNRKDDMIFDL